MMLQKCSLCKCHVSGTVLAPSGYPSWLGLHWWGSNNTSSPGRGVNPQSFLFICFNWFVSVAFMFFFLTSFTLLILSFLRFLSFLVTSRFAPGWELPWGALLGHFLLSKRVKRGKEKILLSEAMGKIAGRVHLGCHMFGDNLSCCCRVQVMAQPLCTASTSLNYAREGTM